MNSAQPVIVVEDISKTFHMPDSEPVHALRNVTNHVDKGEVLCVIGPFAITQRLFDVWVMLAFGILGYVMRRMRYPLPPLVLGIILGDLLDKNLRRGLILSDGSLEPFFTRPISAGFAAACVLTVAMSVPAVRRGGRAALQRLTGRRPRP